MVNPAVSLASSAAGDSNLRLAAFDLSGGRIYSIKMEWLNHHYGIVLPYRWNNNTIMMDWEYHPDGLTIPS